MKNISYLQFLRYSLDDKQKLQESAKIIDWNIMLVWAERQSVVGIIFDGILRAGKDIGIPPEILYKWIGYANLKEQGDEYLFHRKTKSVIINS